MASAIFFIEHEPTNSRVLVEFALIGGKLEIMATEFLRGKVIDLRIVRACREEAKKLLHCG